MGRLLCELEEEQREEHGPRWKGGRDIVVEKRGWAFVREGAAVAL